MPPTPNEKNTELDELALELYAKRAGSHTAAQAEAVVLDSYRKASTFLEVKRRIAADGIKAAVPEELPGADCCAPNLPATHPLNLVARLHTDRKGVQTQGNLEKVNRIKKFLDLNPTPEKEADADILVNKFAQNFPGLGWNVPEINTARATFPTYCKS